VQGANKKSKQEKTPDVLAMEKERKELNARLVALGNHYDTLRAQLQGDVTRWAYKTEAGIAARAAHEAWYRQVTDLESLKHKTVDQAIQDAAAAVGAAADLEARIALMTQYGLGETTFKAPPYAATERHTLAHFEGRLVEERSRADALHARAVRFGTDKATADAQIAALKAREPPMVPIGDAQYSATQVAIQQTEAEMRQVLEQRNQPKYGSRYPKNQLPTVLQM